VDPVIVLRVGLALAAWGGALGLAVSVWLGRLVEGRVYGVAPFDPMSLGLALLVLAGVGLVAAWLPARRAARVDPVIVLRVD
jgi:ABC-type antimicrobial peptide transport system permease subunit